MPDGILTHDLTTKLHGVVTYRNSLALGNRFAKRAQSLGPMPVVFEILKDIMDKIGPGP